MFVQKAFSTLSFKTNFNVFSFSTFLSQAGQRAVWACKIGKLITEPVSQQQKAKQSLLSKIMQVTIEDTTFAYNEEIRKQSLKMFTEGIPLNSEVFNQHKIQYAKQPAYLRKFIFHPNYLVTPQVFKVLRRGGPCSFSYSGDGIGKTSSILLFIHLHYPLHKFIYQAHYDKTGRTKKELEELKKLDLIDYIDKYWYWSIDWGKIRSHKFSLEQIIFEQTTEMCDEHRNILKNYIGQPSIFVRKLIQFYQPTLIHRNCIVDQIDIAAGYAREWNHHLLKFEQKLQQNKREIQYVYYRKNTMGWEQLMKQINQLLAAQRHIIKQKQLEEQKQLQNLKATQQIIKIMQEFRIYGRWFKYFSSNENDQCLLRYEGYDGRIGLGLSSIGRQSNIQPIIINSYLQKQWGKDELYRLIWLEINRKLKQQKKIAAEEIQQAKQYFEQCKHKIEIHTFYRLLDIRECIKEQMQCKLKQINQSSICLQLRELIDLIVRNFKERILTKRKSDLLLFLKYGNAKQMADKKKIIHLLILITLYEKSMNNQTSEFGIQFDLQRIEDILGRKSWIRYFLRSKQHFNEFLPLQISEFSRKITFQCTFQQFIQVTVPCIYPQFQKFYSLYMSDHQQRTYYKDPFLLSRIFQHIFRETLRSNAVISLQFKKVRLTWKIHKVLQSQDFGFMHSNPSYNFEKMLNQLNRNPEKTIVILPKKKPSNKNCKNLSCVDAIFLTRYCFNYFMNKLDITSSLQKINVSTDPNIRIVKAKGNKNILINHIRTILSIDQQNQLKSQQRISLIESLRINERPDEPSQKMCIQQFRDLLVLVKKIKWKFY